MSRKRVKISRDLLVIVTLEKKPKYISLLFAFTLSRGVTARVSGDEFCKYSAAMRAIA